MTSKEVIKAMECCYGKNELTCEDCPMFKKSISWCKEEIAEKCIEIVKSLRDENETLKRELKKELAEHEEFTQNAKAEIERLTEVNAKIISNKDDMKRKYKADLEYYKGLVISEKEGAFWDGVNEGESKAVEAYLKELQ